MDPYNYDDREKDSYDYEVFNLIGEGSFGKVYKARCRRTNQVVAYKVISKNGRKQSEVFALREECKIQRYLQHPNIIRMLDSFETETKLVVITEFAQKDLCRILKEEGVFSEIKAQKVLVDLVAALHYLHSNRVLHRDLKPQNVLVDMNGTAKLCDFGFAKSLGNDLKVLTSIKGTPLYMAPELMNEFPYDHNADLWSLGCIAYELVTGHTPYTTASILELIKMIKFKQIKWPNYLSDVCLSFLKGLLQKNPQQRLSWPYLLLHPFVAFAFYSSAPDYSKMNLCYPLPMNPYTFVPVQSPLSNMMYDPNLRMTPETNQFRHVNLNDQQIPKFNKSNERPVEQPTSDSTDAAFTAQKEEWMEFLKKTISDVMYVGDVDVLIQKPSLMLIMNAFNSCKNCPTVVTAVTRLLSLPFVVELITESQLSSIKQNYAYCGIMKDLVNVVRQIVIEMDTNTDTNRETALQHLLLLICNLAFIDQRFLKQFFSVSVSSNVFKIIKTCLSIRTKNEPLSVVKYTISLFLRLYMIIPQSRPLIASAFQNCIPELHSLLREDEDITVHVRLCIFITILGCTQPNFFSKANGVDSLIEDLSQLKINFGTPSVKRVTEGTLEVLKNSTFER